MSKQESYSHIFLAARSQLARVFSRIVPPNDIEDIVQETYVRLCQVKKKNEIREVRSFLVTTARNLALDYVKRAESRLAIRGDEDFDSGQEGYDQTFSQVASNEEFAFFCEAVRELPLQCRRVFVLKKVYGYSQKEISQQLNISENTVEKHVASGIKRCTLLMLERKGNARETGKSCYDVENNAWVRS